MDPHVTELIREVASKLPSNLHVEEPAYPLSPFLESLPTFMFFSWHCPLIEHRVANDTADLAPLIRDYHGFLTNELKLVQYNEPQIPFNLLTERDKFTLTTSKKGKHNRLLLKIAPTSIERTAMGHFVAVKPLQVNLVFSKTDAEEQPGDDLATVPLMCELYRKGGDYLSFIKLYVQLNNYFSRQLPALKQSSDDNVPSK